MFLHENLFLCPCWIDSQKRQYYLNLRVVVHGKEASFSYQKSNGTSSYHAKSYDFVAGEHHNPLLSIQSTGSLRYSVSQHSLVLKKVGIKGTAVHKNESEFLGSILMRGSFAKGLHYGHISAGINFFFFWLWSGLNSLLLQFSGLAH